MNYKNALFMCEIYLKVTHLPEYHSVIIIIII